jgi:Lar family restriction alleviation protein
MPMPKIDWKLRPCPFCGEKVEASWSPRVWRKGIKHLWLIRCNNCRVTMSARMDHENLMATWNHRAVLLEIGK